MTICLNENRLSTEVVHCPICPHGINFDQTRQPVTVWTYGSWKTEEIRAVESVLLLARSSADRRQIHWQLIRIIYHCLDDLEHVAYFLWKRHTVEKVLA